MTGQLAGKAALVTGGSRGIGRAIAQRLAGDGAHVVLSYLRDREATGSVVAAIAAAGGAAQAVQCDLAAADAAQRLFRQAEQAVGPLDIVVNSAGIAPTGMIADTSDEEFDAVLTVNLKSPFMIIREAGPADARRRADRQCLDG